MGVTVTSLTDAQDVFDSGMSADAAQASLTTFEAAIADYLAALRIARDVPQAVLGAELGRDQSYVSKIEHCQRRVTVAEALRWADALGLSFDEFASGLRPLWEKHVETRSIWEREEA